LRREELTMTGLVYDRFTLSVTVVDSGRIRSRRSVEVQGLVGRPWSIINTPRANQPSQST
jgi:hypothetical protein